MRLMTLVAGLVLGGLTALPVVAADLSVVRVPLPTLPLGVVAFPSGKAINVSVSPGAGAVRLPGDPPGRIWTITDRGPSIDCSLAAEHRGADVRDLCAGANGGRISVLPGYAPSIYAIDIGPDRARFAEMIVLTGASGRPLTGIVNPPPAGNPEQAVTPDGQPIPPDPSGIFPGALVRMPDGRFWVAENFGPSLLEVSPDGRVLRRLVPAMFADSYRNADYPVEATLPDIVGLRATGRGFEGLALSPDGQHLYAALQNAVMNPGPEAFHSSPAVRILRIEARSGRTTAEFLYALDPATSYPRPPGAGSRPWRQSDVRVTELTALADGRLLVLERLAGACRIYRVDPSASPVLPEALAQPLVQPALETIRPRDWSLLGARPMDKTLIATLGETTPFGRRLNGMALLSDHEIAVIANNDFGIDGSRPEMFRLTLPVSVLK